MLSPEVRALDTAPASVLRSPLCVAKPSREPCVGVAVDVATVCQRAVGAHDCVAAVQRVARPRSTRLGRAAHAARGQRPRQRHRRATNGSRQASEWPKGRARASRYLLRRPLRSRPVGGLSWDRVVCGRLVVSCRMLWSHTRWVCAAVGVVRDVVLCRFWAVYSALTSPHPHLTRPCCRQCPRTPRARRWRCPW